MPRPDLLDGKPHRISLVEVGASGFDKFDKLKITIASSPWTLVDRLDEDRFLVKYHEESPAFILDLSASTLQWYAPRGWIFI